uniref:SAM domain-containing protein n=1 Tax=Pseudonaja textilis TaxID=8673 RepID=A0A670YNL9_PSETE
MDLRSTPYRSEVARWSPNELADYFRRLNFKDCEKVVRKLNITGQRFLVILCFFSYLSILSKLSQEINRHEEKRSIFTKRFISRFKNQLQKQKRDTFFILIRENLAFQSNFYHFDLVPSWNLAIKSWGCVGGQMGNKHVFGNGEK